MRFQAPQYPTDYDGYRYTHPDVPGPAITAESMKQAWEEGKAACRDREDGAPRPTNPYAGLSQTLDEVWSNGYLVEDDPRIKRFVENDDQPDLVDAESAKKA